MKYKPWHFKISVAIIIIIGLLITASHASESKVIPYNGGIIEMTDRDVCMSEVSAQVVVDAFERGGNTDAQIAKAVIPDCGFVSGTVKIIGYLHPVGYEDTAFISYQITDGDTKVFIFRYISESSDGIIM